MTDLLRAVAIIAIVIAATLIVFGRVKKRNSVAITGYALLGLAAITYLLERGTT